MRVLKILSGTSVDGPGLRTSIYFAGCSHHCHGCHNELSWDFAGGEERTVDSLVAEVLQNEEHVTLSGGDPLQQPLDQLQQLLQALKAENLNVWCFTGYTLEQLLDMPEMKPILALIDVLVDSPFVLAQRDTSLRFRGSSNQRIIDLPATLTTGQLTLAPYADKINFTLR